jgi:hypothetical protein
MRISQDVRDAMAEKHANSPNTATACISPSPNDFVAAPATAESIQARLAAVPVIAMTAGAAALTRWWVTLC